MHDDLMPRGLRRGIGWGRAGARGWRAAEGTAVGLAAVDGVGIVVPAAAVVVVAADAGAAPAVVVVVVLLLAAVVVVVVVRIGLAPTLVMPTYRCLMGYGLGLGPLLLLWMMYGQRRQLHAAAGLASGLLGLLSTAPPTGSLGVSEPSGRACRLWTMSCL